ncbi:tRNA lysidine(34) synthetase TilS [Xanthobacter sp. AM11]|uniref:tRNA lysidine(34) synthetase TilS n=1 Tax=Xanthobacter sp. AM11 TaxID=3380643 RepID=UPI0039BF005C
MSAADGTEPIAEGELAGLFAGFLHHPCILIAVSGGPDSTALLHLAARWRALRADGPALFAATVDHGLRAASTGEAEAVGHAASRLRIPHHTLAWSGAKPERGIQEAARDARYGLLAAAARETGATALALAHTLDDQAETVLFRLARGSGLSGLAGMQGASVRDGLVLLRPFLAVPKARLVATLQRDGITFVQDPSNQDARFARPRLRALAPALAVEGLDAGRLARLARRMARADAALEAATDTAAARLGRAPEASGKPVTLDLEGFGALPEEIALRLLGRAVAAVGSEGPVELAKLEALLEALKGAAGRAPAPFRRTLAGALVTVRNGMLTVETAPPRRETRAFAVNSGGPQAGVLGKERPRS